MPRPTFEPTDRHRGQVEAMVACGIPENEIAVAIGISEPTLRKHFKTEIDVGMTKVKLNVGSFIVNSILGRDGGIKDERSRATLAIFFAKTRMGWKESVLNENVGKDGGPLIIKVLGSDAKL